MLAGLVDSLCLSFAWTVLLLHIVSHFGLGAAGLVSAAMLVGVALSAPWQAGLRAYSTDAACSGPRRRSSRCCVWRYSLCSSLVRHCW